jgi:hypothetical protein
LAKENAREEIEMAKKWFGHKWFGHEEVVWSNI